MQTNNRNTSWTNVHPLERWASILSGGAMAAAGLKKGRLGVLHIATGAVLIQRGVTGRCRVYQALGVRTAPAPLNGAMPYEIGVRVRSAVTVNRPRSEVFGYWRQLENLPQFMTHLESVQQTGDGRSHWVAQGPLGKSLAWDAEILNEAQDEIIAWRSLPGSQVDSAGSVRFKDAPGGRGTEIRVELQYNPPAGMVGAYAAKLFGRDAQHEIDHDLLRLKQFLESGEIATTQGQSVGPEKPVRRKTPKREFPALEEVSA